MTTDTAADLEPDRQEMDSSGSLRRRLTVPVGHRIEVLLAGLLAAATFLVHDMGYVLTAPLWNDETWVAISTKLPLEDLLRVTASSPPGWTLLLRLVPFGYPEGIRIVPMIFAALTVVAAFVYARSIPWRSVLVGRTAATLAGVAALLVPSVLGRNDLKQYTADAFFALVMLWFVSRLESHWSRPRLIQLAACTAIAFIFSAAALFVGAACFAGVIFTAITRRRWRQARDALVVGALCGALLIGFYLAVYRPGLPPGLNQYWARYYVPLSNGWSGVGSSLAQAQDRLIASLGLGPPVVAVGLLIAGVVTLAKQQRPACALVVPLLLGLMVGLAAARQYPLFDVRTSHFLTTAIAVTAAIGVAGLCQLASRVHATIPVILALVVATVFVTSAPVRAGIRAHAIPPEDLATPTAFIAAHELPGDTVVVGMLSSWGFAYHWPFGRPSVLPVTTNLPQFLAVFPDQPNILVARNRTPDAVRDIMAIAARRAGEPDATGRIWVIHTHTLPTERAAFRDAATQHQLKSTSVIPGSLDLLTTRAAP